MKKASAKAVSPPNRLSGSISEGNVNRGILVAALALAVAAPLVPGEAAAEYGVGAILVLLWLLLVVVWTASTAMLGARTLRINTVDLAVAVFAVMHSLSVLVNIGYGHTRPLINVLWQWLGLLASYFLFRFLLQSQAAVRTVCLVLVGLTVALSALGLYQFAYELPRQRAAFAADPESMLREAGIDVRPGTPKRKLFEDRLNSTEPMATFALANSLAGLLAPWLIVTLGIGLAGYGLQRERGRVLLGVVLTCLAIGICLLLTKSRTAVLATGCGVFLVFWYHQPTSRLGVRRRGLWAATAGLLLVACGVVAAALWDRLVLAESFKSLLYRVQYWRSTVSLIADHPWFGCGPGNFKQVYPAYKLPEASETVAEPHNFFLEIWATAGTLAAIAFLAILVAAAIHVVRSIRADGTSPVTDSTTDGPKTTSPPPGLIAWWTYAAGVAGMLLGVVVAMTSGFPADLAVLWLGLPAGAICVALLHPWVPAGNLPVWLVPVATLVLLVNLLAAGGIGFPGVAQTFWVLLACIVAQAPSATRQFVLPRFAVGLACLVALVLLLLNYMTMYRPVLTGQTRLAEGRTLASAGHLDRAIDAYRLAAEADPMSSEPWSRLAGVYHAFAISSGADRWLKKFRQAELEVFARNPNAPAVHQHSGDWNFTLWDRFRQQALLDRSIDAYERLAASYPNNSLAHAQLAVAENAAGERAAAARAATKALELDAQMPHDDRKLARQKIIDPTVTGGAVVDIEQRMLELRRLR